MKELFLVLADTLFYTLFHLVFVGLPVWLIFSPEYPFGWTLGTSLALTVSVLVWYHYGGVREALLGALSEVL